MARSNYSAGKRQRELQAAKKKKEKLNKRHNRVSGGEVPIATAEEIQGGDLLTPEQVLQKFSGDAGEGDSAARAIPSRLFVGGLAWRVTTDQLKTEFEKIGSVNDAVVVLDRDTGDSRGFGFVTMADRKDAAEAIRKLNGQDLEGRSLVVRQATERSR